MLSLVMEWLKKYWWGLISLAGGIVVYALLSIAVLVIVVGLYNWLTI